MDNNRLRNDSPTTHPSLWAPSVQVIRRLFACKCRVHVFTVICSNRSFPRNEKHLLVSVLVELEHLSDGNYMTIFIIGGKIHRQRTGLQIHIRIGREGSMSRGCEMMSAFGQHQRSQSIIRMTDLSSGFIHHSGSFAALTPAPRESST